MNMISNKLFKDSLRERKMSREWDRERKPGANCFCKIFLEKNCKCDNMLRLDKSGAKTEFILFISMLLIYL